MSGSSGLPLRFAHDEERRVTSWTDTNDRRYDYVHDTRDSCIAEGGTAGHMQVRIDYDQVGERTGHKVTTLTTAAGRTTHHLFDDRFHVVAVIDPLGNTVHTERDAFNHPLTRTGALGRVTTFAYDDAGRPTRITRPDGLTTAVTRNALGLPTELREADGAVWRYGYDERGNRITATDPAGHTTRYAYDGRGHLASVTDALGETTHVRCDAAGMPVEITDPLGAVTRYERDAFGRPVALADPLGAVTRLEWTVEGKLSRRVDPDGTEQSWACDGEGNCVRHTDANGGVTSYEYTHFDLLAARTGRCPVHLRARRRRTSWRSPQKTDEEPVFPGLQPYRRAMRWTPPWRPSGSWATSRSRKGPALGPVACRPGGVPGPPPRIPYLPSRTTGGSAHRIRRPPGGAAHRTPVVRARAAGGGGCAGAGRPGTGTA